MKLHSVLKNHSNLFKEIEMQCQQFLVESNCNPLIGSWPTHYPNVKRVKMRKRKNSTDFSVEFNKAFYSQYPAIRNRSIIVDPSLKPDTDRFYVFPADGYKFMYSPRITDSLEQYGDTLVDIQKTISLDKNNSFFRDILLYSYKDTDLEKAILENCEIIIYNIPFFYVVRSNITYQQILEYIK